MTEANVIRAEVVNMTPEFAKLLRTTAHFERQRPIAETNVVRLANEMSNGWFVEGTPIFLGVLPDDSMVILNGNHTLEAVIKSGVSIPLTMIYRSVTNIEHAAQIYANMDIQKVRSWRNALQALEGDAATAFDAKVISALGLVITKFSASSTDANSSRTARFELFEEYGNAAQMFENCIRNCYTKHRQYVTRAPVLAVALITTKAQPSVAVEFWQGLVNDDGLAANDPRKVLLRYFGNNAVAPGGNSRINQARAAALAWNAYYSDQTLDYVKPGQVKTMVILGTPWHKGPPETTATKKYKPMIATAVVAPAVETGIDAKGKKVVTAKRISRK